MKYKTELRAIAQLTKMSKNDISDTFKPITNENKDSGFKPTEEMVSAARQGLALSDSGLGGSKLSVALATSLVNGENLTISQVKRIDKFFSKLSENSDFYLDQEEDNINTKAVSYLLYGSKYGKEWASDIIAKESERVKASEQLDPDLLRMKSILVSQGMNLNDDVFLKEELVKARLTGSNKPVNIEHDDTEIIGHMLSTYVVSKDGERLEDLEDIDLEDEIDIVNEAVIYSYIFPEIASKIQDLASKNELFVSVEAWFSEYDYLLGGQIVKRTESTSNVLEKHLRINGGDGNYNGQKVARVLRNMMFGGVGVVATPANPESLIIEVGDVENAMASEQAVLASHVIGEIRELNDFVEAKKKEETMDEEKLDKSDSNHSEEDVSLDLQEQKEDSVEKTDEITDVTASDNNSAEEKVDVDLTAKEEVEVENSEVVEANSQEDVQDDVQEVSEVDSADPIEASVEESDSSENETEEVVESAEAEVLAEANLDGAHEHPEIMTRIDEIMAVLGGMTNMMARQNDIIGSLDEKLVLLQSESIISQRHQDMINAGLSEDFISSRMDKMASMEQKEFESYLEDVQSIVKSSDSSKEEDINTKEVEQEKSVSSDQNEGAEDSQINLDNIEPTSAEMNIETNSSSNETYDKFLQVLSSSFTKNKRR